MGQSLWVVLQGVGQMQKRAPRSKKVDRSSLKDSEVPRWAGCPCTLRRLAGLQYSFWERQTTCTLPIFMSLQKVSEWKWREQVSCLIETLWRESSCSLLSNIPWSVLALWSPPFPLPPLFYWMTYVIVWSVRNVWSWHAAVWQHLEWRIENPWVLKQLCVSRDSQAGQCPSL